MALVLNVYNGESVFANDVEITVKKVISTLEFIVEVGGNTYTITDEKGVLVCPHVILSAGKGSTLKTARMCVTAPRSIKILREKLYRKDQRDYAKQN